MLRFREIILDDAKKILDWRTSARVTRFLNSDMKYDLEEQRRWLAASYKKSNYYHWIIQYGDRDVGLLSFVDWNAESRTTSWGFYIGEEEALGIGGLVPPYFYNFAFDFLRVEKVFAEVFYSNTITIDLHLKQGYSFDPTRNYVIQKNGKDILMVCMMLDKKTFKASKFSRMKQELPTKGWDENPF